MSVCSAMSMALHQQLQTERVSAPRSLLAVSHDIHGVVLVDECVAFRMSGSQ
jgi:hypothetical protein